MTPKHASVSISFDLYQNQVKQHCVKLYIFQILLKFIWHLQFPFTMFMWRLCWFAHVLVVYYTNHDRLGPSCSALYIIHINCFMYYPNLLYKIVCRYRHTYLSSFTQKRYKKKSFICIWILNNVKIGGQMSSCYYLFIWGLPKRRYHLPTYKTKREWLRTRHLSNITWI